jgi:hypothetical protein
MATRWVPERLGRLEEKDGTHVKVLLATLVAAALVGAPTAAIAAPRAPAPPAVGYDVSYPQCSGGLPSSPAFAIVGVNDGIVFSPNPCLAAQYNWATHSSSTTQPKVQFYANTGNPGPVLSGHWPNGQQTPHVCDPGTWSDGCAYDYGYNAAQDSFADAATAAGGGGTGSAVAAAAPWWLDVESANSWSTVQTSNISALNGAVAGLRDAGVTSVGFYSNASSWSSLVGSQTVFAASPSWVPGSRSQKAAASNCSVTITGGRAKYAQYASGAFDADYVCP